MVKKGIDISVWNGQIDWVKVKSQIDFAILRAGYGREISQKDKRFEENYKKCKENGIPCGAYWYNYATTVADAKLEAQACLEALKGKNFDYPIWYDIEENATLTKGAVTVSAIAKVFLDTVADAGYKVGIYSFKSAFDSYFTNQIKNHYDVWVANVGSNGEALSSTSYQGHKMWQYSWKGAIDGINGDVDLDYCYEDYEENLQVSPPQTDVKKESKEDTSISQTKQSKVKEEQIDVIYSAYIGSWLNEITNYNDINNMGYAGIKGRSISGIGIKASKGVVRYRVHINGSRWLNWMTDYDLSNWITGVAGIKGRNIDAIQAELIGVEGYQIQYRVANNGKNYLNWITGYGNGSMGYAGIYGKNIERIQMRIVKI